MLFYISPLFGDTLMADAVKVVTRTIYGSVLQTSQSLAIPHHIHEFTTVNQAIELEDVVPYQPNPKTVGAQYAESYNPETDTDSLSIKYMVIGNGGHGMISSGNRGVPVPTEKPHRASDANLFNILPFVCKPIDDDLSKEQRENYRLRKILQIDGEYYVAYFAKVLPISDATPKMVHTKIRDGIATEIDFVPSVANINPEDPVIGQENDGSYLSVTSTIPVDFDNDDVSALREACEILYGTSDLAMISEIGICSGVDKLITQQYPITGAQTSANISNQGLMEAVGVQVNCFINPFFKANSADDGFAFNFDVGSSEPLFSTR